MTPPIPSSKITLSYPVYACDFDPSDPDLLVVGGGGGVGKNGVGNKITVLKTARPDVLEEVCEVTLSKEEDNVTSLAVAARDTLIYAGINASPAAVERGRNEHFRTFGLQTAAITEVARAQLFQEPDPNAYQRVLRLSRRAADDEAAAPQLALVSTGSTSSGAARRPEIVVCDVAASGAPPRVRGRIVPVAEAVDLDVVRMGRAAHTVAYCDETTVYATHFAPGAADPADPLAVYALPTPPTPRGRPALKALRFLGPHFLLALVNMPANAGATLDVLRLDAARARVALSARVGAHVKKATGLAVANLSPGAPPHARTQFVVAVAGTDASISLFSLEYAAVGRVEQCADLRAVAVIRSVHANILTCMTFSEVMPPRPGTGPPTNAASLHLASGSVVNSVVVHTLALRLAPPSSTEATSPRYVLALAPARSPFLLALSLFIALLAIALAFLASSPGLPGPHDLLSPPLRLAHPRTWAAAIRHRASAARPDESPDAVTVLVTTHQDMGPAATLPHLLAQAKADAGVVVVVRPGEADGAGTDKEASRVPRRAAASLHDERLQGPHGGRAWGALSTAEKESWRARLRDGGLWGEKGEEGLERVFFAEGTGD